MSISIGVIFARDRVDCHALSLGLIAIVFWLWALAKVIVRGDEDLGAVSFAFVLAAAAYSRWALKAFASSESRLERAVNSSILLSGACCIVGLNYAYVLITKYESLRPTFQLYLAVGVAWWGSAFMWTATSLYSYARSLRAQAVDFETESLVEGSYVKRFNTLLAQ